MKKGGRMPQMLRNFRGVGGVGEGGGKNRRKTRYVICERPLGANSSRTAITILAFKRHSNNRGIEGWRRLAPSEPGHDGEGAPVPPSPTPQIQHLKWEKGGPILLTLGHKFLYARQCVPKKIPRRWLGFFPAVISNVLRFLHNCPGLLHILCEIFVSIQMCRYFFTVLFRE